MRADSPVEVFSQPDPISQCAGNLSAHQGGDLPIQSRPVEVSTQGQHEQESAAARGGKEQIQEQGRRAPQTPQQSKQPGQQGGQSPTPQATHFKGLLRKAAAGADSRHNRSKYDYQRPASSHQPRPRRAYPARRVLELQAALMTCPASFRRNLEDQLASANLALRERHNHRQSHLVLTTQALVLRGEENRQFPLEVPLWTQHLGPSSTFLAPVPVSSAQKQRK